MTSHLRVRAVALIAGLTAALGAGIATAPQAQAASPISFCAKYYNNYPYASQSVTLQKWNGSAWQNWRAGGTNASGCGVFTNYTAAAGYYRVQAYWTVGTRCGNPGITYGLGQSQFIYLSYNQSANFGTFYVGTGRIC
ncbi:hypothetical protein ABLE94_00630 [Gordonia sp. VNK1]|uniref:hypothetical protein n=1 Tax=Gordonia oleivorans TaxID=3156618 RepID=UPI0032B34DBE